MLTFEKYDEHTAPGKPRFTAAKQAQQRRYPGLHAIMAESPQLLAGYQALHSLFLHSSFDNDEKPSSGRPSTLSTAATTVYRPIR
ncbi:hypothetical protein O0544_08200 [Edwardsiella anguillarum]|nr:hypothetical protein [Edwardsiella anguillarum]